MEIDWSVPVSIAVGGITVLTAAGVASATALYIHWRKRKDDHIKQVKDRMDAHRTVWYALRQIEAEEKRKEVEEKQHVLDMSDIQWLRDYFRDNAALLAPKLHDAYQSALEIDVFLRSDFKSEFGKDIDLPGMISIAKKELDAYEQRYRDIGWFDPRERRLWGEMVKRRYWATGPPTLVAALLYHVIPDGCAAKWWGWHTDEWFCSVLEGILLFPTIVLGAAFGVALGLLWHERDNERRSRSQ